MKRNTSIYIIVSAIAAILVLTACSGVIGGETSVRIAVDELSGAKYISPSVDLDSGYVAVMKEDKVYSVNELPKYDFENGYIYITDLVPGDYVFGVALIEEHDPATDDDDVNVGLAIKEVKIKKGFNNVYMDVGPGIATFTIGGVDFSDFFAPDGFGVSFATDTIILDTNQTGNIVIAFSEGLGGGTITAAGGGTVTSNLVDGKTYNLTIRR